MNVLGSCTPGTVGRRLRPINLDTTGSHQQQMVGKPHTLYQIRPHHSWLKGRTYLKRIRSRNDPLVHLIMINMDQ
jgi:hypothetical protein